MPGAGVRPTLSPGAPDGTHPDGRAGPGSAGRACPPVDGVAVGGRVRSRWCSTRYRRRVSRWPPRGQDHREHDRN